LDRTVHRDVEVGVIEHDERVLAAHLELRAREAFGERHGHTLADRL
jgi:hypothetical protein